MRESSSAADGVREQRRAVARATRHRARTRQRMRRGQSLVIFALSVTTLIGLAGLAIDVARAFDLYAKMQRAAEAGSLAGVLYMPANYNTPLDKSDPYSSAITRAQLEAQKNGFDAKYVDVEQVQGKGSDLKVTVSQTLDVVLLSVLGVAPTSISASAQAEYLPPVRIGARQNYFGDQEECQGQSTPCAITDGGAHLQYFMAHVNGPSVLKEEGDPTVYCAEGPNEISDGNGGPTQIDSRYPVSVYNGDPATSHPQFSDSAAAVQQHCGTYLSTSHPGNPDSQPDGYAGEATKDSKVHPGGYNYYVTVTSDKGSLWIFNPSFIPEMSQNDPRYNPGYDPSNRAATLNPNTLDALYVYPKMTDPFGNGVPAFTANPASARFDAPPFYSTMTYSLYNVPNIYNRSSDTLVTSQSFQPYDRMPADLTLHHCGGGLPAFDPQYATNSYTGDSGSGGCVDLNDLKKKDAAYYHAWVDLADHLKPGTYRLVVEMSGLTSEYGDPAHPTYKSDSTNGWGDHSYSVKVCASLVADSPIGCSDGATGDQPGDTVAGWNNETVFFQKQSGNLVPNPNDPNTSCAATPGNPYACLDLGCIPGSYSGRTINLNIYDPGDGDGAIYLGVVKPANNDASVTYVAPTAAIQGTVNGVPVVQAQVASTANYNTLNGLMLTVQLALGPNYQGNCLTGSGGTGWWQLMYATESTATTPRDVLSVSFSLAGSPVHLVPPDKAASGATPTASASPSA